MNIKYFLILLVFFIKSINAANIEVKPTKLFLDNHNKVTTLHVTNLSNSETLIQVDKYKWGMKKDYYTLDNTKDLISSPAMFKLPPKQTQIIRIGIREFQDSNTEKPYRIILREVHPQSAKDSMGLKIKLQISIPLFISPTKNEKKSDTKSDITWKATTNKDFIDITATNKNSYHHNVFKFSLVDGKKTKNIKTFVYLLPDNSYTWKIDYKDMAKGNYALYAETDLGLSSVSKEINIK